MRVDESWRSNASESCNSHQLSSSFDRAFKASFISWNFKIFPGIAKRIWSEDGSMIVLDTAWRSEKVQRFMLWTPVVLWLN